MNELLNNFLIFDMVLLSYQGDHVICDSTPLILKPDEGRVSYEEYDCHFFFGEINKPNYNVLFTFKFSNEMNFHCLDGIEIKVNQKFIESIFKK
jgi:hypothetical protein